MQRISRYRTAAVLAILAMIAGALFAFAPTASAATITLTTDDQQWVNQAAPTATNCTPWSQVHGSATAKKRTAVSFPAPSIPAGETITAATLRIFARNNYSGNNVSVKAYTRTGALGCNLTWNNLGTVGSQVGVSSGSFVKNTYKDIAVSPSSINATGRTAFVLDASAAALMEFRSDASGSNLNPSKLVLTTAPAPTTTTVAPTTTTTAPPTCSPGTPITINTGGTYDGCYRSENSAVPAVSVATSAQVNLVHAEVQHAGFGVTPTVGDAKIKVENSKFQALTPTTNGDEQFALYAYMPDAIEFLDNDVLDGHGVTINGNDATTSPFAINRNDFVNIGNKSQPGCPGSCLGAVHTDKVLAPGGQVQWNRVTNAYGQSLSEDVFGFYFTHGASGNPLDVSNNLVNGAYPYSGDGASFTGGAFDLGDGDGSYMEGVDNVAVNYTNNGFMIPSGQHIHHDNSVAVYDGLAGTSGSGTRVSSTFGAGYTTWHNPSYPASTDIGVTDSQGGHRRWTGSTWEPQDFYLPEGTNSGNTSVAATNAQELSTIAAFEARSGAALIGADW